MARAQGERRQGRRHRAHRAALSVPARRVPGADRPATRTRTRSSGARRSPATRARGTASSTTCCATCAPDQVLGYAMRASSASPAAGYLSLHNEQQKELVDAALQPLTDNLVHAGAGLTGRQGRKSHAQSKSKFRSSPSPLSRPRCVAWHKKAGRGGQARREPDRHRDRQGGARAARARRRRAGEDPQEATGGTVVARRGDRDDRYRRQSRRGCAGGCYRRSASRRPAKAGPSQLRSSGMLPPRRRSPPKRASTPRRSQGTGRDGRVTKGDVHRRRPARAGESLLQQPPAPVNYRPAARRPAGAARADVAPARSGSPSA